jgi:hypothetical protein
MFLKLSPEPVRHEGVVKFLSQPDIVATGLMLCRIKTFEKSLKLPQPTFKKANTLKGRS